MALSAQISHYSQQLAQEISKKEHHKQMQMKQTPVSNWKCNVSKKQADLCIVGWCREKGSILLKPARQTSFKIMECKQI